MTSAAGTLAAFEEQAPPFYRPVGREVEVFHAAWENRLSLLLKGPTGCGKSRFVEYMAASLGRPLVTVSCHDDTTATDLLGRYLLRGGETVWQDGPVTRAVRQDAILYLDEVMEARSDVVVVIHSLTDHRRRLFIERHNEELAAGPGFLLVVSGNPGYAQSLKELKPSTRQRFVSLAFDWPEPGLEREILQGETGIDAETAKRLATLGGKFRHLEEFGLAEGASTRLLVNAARLIQGGLPPRLACRQAIVEPLCDDREINQGLMDLVAMAF